MVLSLLALRAMNIRKWNMYCAIVGEHTNIKVCATISMNSATVRYYISIPVR